MKTPQELEREIQATKANAARLESELSSIRNNCPHQWGEVQPDHIVREGYTDPGDPPGTMGVDWRGPVYVPAETIHRWRRVCQKCGKIEHTSKTTKQVSETPKF